MTTNTSMTYYHKTVNTETRLEKWTRSVIDSVMWQGGKGARINKGYENANDVKVFIPTNQTLPNFCIGDIIVKGTITQIITKQSDLLVDSYNITSIVTGDYGSNSMKHIELGGK